MMSPRLPHAAAPEGIADQENGMKIGEASSGGVVAFSPRPMKLSILTAALQELTPRERRDVDPDLAIEEWLEFAVQIGAPNIELSAALHPSESDVPAAALLDPVANTLDLRAPFSAARAARVQRAMQSTRVGLSDLAYFDNMLAA